METITGTTRDAGALAAAIRTKSRYRTSGAVSGEYVAARNVYIVRSYGEPIAAYHYGASVGEAQTDGIVSERKFSVTTSRHQSVAWRALDLMRPLGHPGYKRTIDRIDGDGETY